MGEKEKKEGAKVGGREGGRKDSEGGRRVRERGLERET